MKVVDSSAVVAVLKGEVDAAEMVDAMSTAIQLRMSAATFVECALVVDALRDPLMSRRFDTIFAATGIVLVPLTEQQAHIARAAYRDFGRGSGHRAKLNLGDCFSYALAKDRNEPLLCKGDDFRHTDLRCLP